MLTASAAAATTSASASPGGFAPLAAAPACDSASEAHTTFLCVYARVPSCIPRATWHCGLLGSSAAPAARPGQSTHSAWTRARAAGALQERLRRARIWGPGRRKCMGAWTSRRRTGRARVSLQLGRQAGRAKARERGRNALLRRQRQARLVRRQRVQQRGHHLPLRRRRAHRRRHLTGAPWTSGAAQRHHHAERADQVVHHTPREY